MSGILLGPADFEAFFREVNSDLEPFPWQKRLALRVCETGEWPECLDLPTASGKTAVLEIAVFHLALEAGRIPHRRAPLRIAFVVDRRLIVDQAEVRARQIQEKLSKAHEDTVSEKIARQLKSLAGPGNPPLWVAKLRGGIPRETDWARTPVQPTVLLSTVDQVGSRLLFRGYGVSDSMKPVHAGLLGSDCLIFLDEAHLSEPFRQTLEWIRRYREEPWSEVPPGPWSVVTLSATPGARVPPPFHLEPADLDSQVLKRRVEASKSAELSEIGGGDIAEAYAKEARSLAEEADLRKVLIVVNRVDLARSIFGKLQLEGAILLTGRVRDVDRTRIVRSLTERLSEPDSKFFAVATQCVEAGADFDFDALVTQVAPLDALRQRFGRLNRTGRIIHAKAAVLATKEELRSKKPDPIYDDRARETWKLLQDISDTDGKKRTVDFGVFALNKTLQQCEERIALASCRKEEAPVMPPAYVDLWSRTSPVPDVDPDVALFLHGPERGPADVEIVWRADIQLDDLSALKELLALIPPRTAETISVPIWKVRQWLAEDNQASANFGDLEGEREPDQPVPPRGRRVLRWLGDDDDRTRIIEPFEIRPGDLIVAPASYGGCDEWGWTGAPTPAVSDVADEAAKAFRAQRIAVRLHRSQFPPDDAGDANWRRVRSAIEAAGEDAAELRSALLGLEDLGGQWNEILSAMVDRMEIAFHYGKSPSDGVVLAGRAKTIKRETSTETDEAANLGYSRASLKAHTAAVYRMVKGFSERLGLSESAQRALLIASELHDLGKGDRRFQAYLRNQTRGSEVLAKSERDPLGPVRERALRNSVGLPDRWRHEALSVRLALLDKRLLSEAPDFDSELILWLIGTHHGQGRPLFPHDDPLDDCARTVSGLDGENVSVPVGNGPQRLGFDWHGSDWVELWDVLRFRYGTWELARFEAILRLADHRASEE